jgi:CBS domain-containing protein
MRWLAPTNNPVNNNNNNNNNNNPLNKQPPETTTTTSRYYGCFSTADALRNFIAAVQAKFPDFADNLPPADALKELGKTFGAQTVDKLQHPGDLWLLQAGDASSVLDAVTESFHVQDAHVHHRLYVCEAAKQGTTTSATKDRTTVLNIQPGSERLSASGMRVTGVVSQSDVVAAILANKQVLGAAADKTVEQLELDDGAVFTVTQDCPALKAFGMLIRDKKSSLGIVDEDGKLVGNLSVSDVRALRSPEAFASLLLGVDDFLRVARGPATPRGTGAVVVVTAATTFLQVLESLTPKHLHRVYVVDADHKPVSIITLTDVLRCVAKA